MNENNLAPVAASCGCGCHRGNMHCDERRTCCAHAHKSADALVEFKPIAMAAAPARHSTIGGRGAVGRIKR